MVDGQIWPTWWKLEKWASHITYLGNRTHAVQHVIPLGSIPRKQRYIVETRHVLHLQQWVTPFVVWIWFGLCCWAFACNSSVVKHQNPVYFCWKWGFPNNVPSGSSSSGCPLLIGTLSWGTTRSSWKESTMKGNFPLHRCLHRRMSASTNVCLSFVARRSLSLSNVRKNYWVLLPVRTGRVFFVSLRCIMTNHDMIMWLSKLGKSVCEPIQLLLFCDSALRFS